jgi:membrane-bound lytic murein transglycosylase B
MTASTHVRAAVVLAGLALAGCTATDPPTPPPATTAASGPAAPALLQQVAARTVAAGTSRFTTTSRLAAASPRDARVAHGAFDHARQRGWWDVLPPRAEPRRFAQRTLRIGRAVYHAVLADRPAVRGRRPPSAGGG